MLGAMCLSAIKAPFSKFLINLQEARGDENTPPLGAAKGSRAPLSAARPPASELKRKAGWPAPTPLKPPLRSLLGVRATPDNRATTPCAHHRAAAKRPPAKKLGFGLSGARASPGPAAVAEVPHFELRKDPDFWTKNNVQVVIRVRPLNSKEKTLHGYNRCIKQESAKSITWIGQPETRFTFDHVACEGVNQEVFFHVAGFPMVENCMAGYNSCIFAYGQTGSGKTYTMLGDISEMGVKPGPERGMTPHILDFLFARIKEEEESRRQEKLKYKCKYSFLEIYNEQITDLLDPSSKNLKLREDMRRNGVYVENLTELDVGCVSDIIELLLQGSVNRRVASTNMNHESSRSHTVLTCVIESRWEKGSTENVQFARLNLVDLAGSERQRTSGADGERLKEAANINKSLSTLGLVDTTKQRHIPYRDSRLTFLLQDSLGGNSKTMIIANVSPSLCSGDETLSTLKFAQRARLIQNNAVVNEDTSGDGLPHQMPLLEVMSQKLKRTYQELQTCRSELQVCLASNKRLKREKADLQMELSAIKRSKMEEYSNLIEHFLSTLGPCDSQELTKMEDCCDVAFMGNTEYTLKPQIEWDVPKTTLPEERIAHAEIEKQIAGLRDESNASSVIVVMKENESFSALIEEKEKKIELLTNDWNRLAADLGSFLVDGDSSLYEASDQAAFLSKASQRTWIGDQVQKILQGISDRDKLIEELQNQL